ncbi:unnamed protein product [Macrosiphum euphorbiae]|uniref:Uncharacterized protein n=1 Tax=Macrosiphum euphorbiae TaxID=13131 RepID=A0AAV0WBV7_9HEMI|nr:unnamed protein product [Macrosiphum euphorbiae]
MAHSSNDFDPSIEDFTTESISFDVSDVTNIQQTIDYFQSNDNLISVDIPVVEGYKYPTEDLIILKKLLDKWNMGCVYQTGIDNLIDLKVLTYMKAEDVYKLLEKFPLGIYILFRHELEEWQKDGNYISLKNNSNQGIQNVQLTSEKSSSMQSKLPCKTKIDEILNSSPQGHLILEYYKQNNKFNDGIRTTLVDIVIGYIISNNIPMSVNVAESLSNQIVAMFSTEIKDVYFLKVGSNKNPKGKLYAKFYNAMRTLKNNGLVSPAVKTVKIVQEINKSRYGNIWTERDFTSEKNIDSILDVLKYNTTSYPDLEENWKSTVNYRLNDIKKSTSTEEILKNWKQYLIPYGHKLIDIDYSALFPDQNVYIEFEKKSDKIYNILGEKVKDSSCLKILDQIKTGNNLNENVKNAALMYLLHGMFAPTSKKVTKDDKGKKPY